MLKNALIEILNEMKIIFALITLTSLHVKYKVQRLAQVIGTRLPNSSEC